MVSPLQIGLLTVFSILTVYDGLSFRFNLNKPVIAGMIAGMIMGDMGVGLMIGGTLQLMILGISGFGGSTIPNYETAAIIATALGIASKSDTETAISLAVPIALFLAQLDIFARFINTILQKKADTFVASGEFKKFELMNYLGLCSFSMSRAVPVVVGLSFGPELVTNLIAVLPAWFLGGIKLSGSILPIVGIAILLKYLPVKDYFAYLVIGFVLFSYLHLDMLGVALIGFSLALIDFKRKNTAVPYHQNVIYEGGDMGDE